MFLLRYKGQFHNYPLTGFAKDMGVCRNFSRVGERQHFAYPF